MKITNRVLTIFCLFTAAACNNNPDQSQMEKKEATKSTATITEADFGITAEGSAKLYTLKNDAGMEVKITNYGGIITELYVPDKNGIAEDVVFGFDNVKDYENDHPYFGAIIGRYGNRIAKGKFTLGGKDYTLATNNPPNTLHGGPMGFHKKLWPTKEIKRPGYIGLEMSRTSPDMEEGFPGNLTATVRYLVKKDGNEILMEYEAVADQPTIVNLTNHAYFNLLGNGKGDILSHELMLSAKHFTPVDNTLIPTGEIKPVEGTPFDFTSSETIGARIDADDEQMKIGGGYDHNFVLDKQGDGIELAATVYEPSSGRVLEVLTTEPGVQFYSGNFLDGSNIGKNNVKYNYRSGLCLETQHYPDSPNKPDFPSTELKPGEKYETNTIYRFSVK